MKPSEQWVSELVRGRQVLPAVSYARVCVEWALVCVVSMVVLLGLFGVRSDIASQLHDPWFVLELFLNVALVLVAGLGAIAGGYPGRARRPEMSALLVMLFFAYGMVVLCSQLEQPMLWQDVVDSAPQGLRCLICIVTFAAGPAAYLFWRLRRLASVRPGYAGASAMLMAMAQGCLGILLEAQGITPAGVVLWHYLPLFLMTLVGYSLGQKIFRW